MNIDDPAYNMQTHKEGGIIPPCTGLTPDALPNILFAYGTKEELKKFARNKENEKCLRCNRLPVCMGLCPRDYMSGFSHCKYEVMDENFEVSLLDYLQHQLG